MIASPYFRPMFALVAVIAILHIAALEFFLYWQWPWFDVLLHFLGGAWVALVTLWFVYFSPWKMLHVIDPVHVVGIALISTITIGLGWEVFEYVFDLTVGEAYYTRDTIADLLMDVAGALCVSAYIFWKK